MTAETRITAARGDGIGPEIMDATQRILEEAGAKLAFDWIEVGRPVYEAGHAAGIAPAAWDALRRNAVFLKGPITTPQGGGYRSLNVTIRKALGLYSNVRPCVSYHPAVLTKHPKMDVVIVRENEEDLYAGIEYRQTQDVVECLKLVSRPGCERVIRSAFEYARANHRSKVTAFVKDNIMKMTDGLFSQVFREVAAEYPEIRADSMIIDIGAARLADTPERFDVIVTLNLYGDIISDVAAQITGSVGLGGSANVGDRYAMFEAIHGSAPDIAGKGIANPSGLLLAAVMMLVHVGQAEPAERIHNAWLRTIEDGYHTADIFNRGLSRCRATTQEFTDALSQRLGSRPQALAPVGYSTTAVPPRSAAPPTARAPAAKALVGVDLFVDWRGGRPDELAARMATLDEGGLGLTMISNRGQVVWPSDSADVFCVDHWRCRFLAGGPDGRAPVESRRVAALFARAVEAGFDVVKTESLYAFDGQPGFSLDPGE